MNRVGVALLAVISSLAVCGVAGAQDPPPRIGPFAVDVHATVPRFGEDDPLAQSRGLSLAELPGSGFGASIGAHVYVARLGPVTIGLGGQATVGRSSKAPVPATDSTTALRGVTETFKTMSPQLSLNFGNGNGWSYLSVGVGRARWSVVPDGADPLPPDEEVLSTVNYGGGARWFAKKHLAFSLDVRMHEIKNGSPQVGLPGSPHALLLVIGAGISVR
jgi:hypothetical protein